MTNVTGEFVNALKNQGKKVLVQYTASWCGPCRSLTPKLERLEKNYEDVSFVKVDVEQNIEHISTLNITSVPTVILYDGNNMISRSVGAQPDDFYKKILDSIE